MGATVPCKSAGRPDGQGAKPWSAHVTGRQAALGRSLSEFTAALVFAVVTAMAPGSLWPLGLPKPSGHQVVLGHLVAGLAGQMACHLGDHMARRLGDQMAGGPGRRANSDFCLHPGFCKPPLCGGLIVKENGHAGGERVRGSPGLSLLVSLCPGSRKVEGTRP
ncbi:hypothetical protein NDU88_006698 [Pleurodeles waltl]|uniref:Uncharacterized protein n=1 Tax=Pleurodeles waltl TaxID=8319 RepID=A0AAV7SQJ7_PLEWA|nr:hypothetical protein NDU88_006698 [Pleurodeles waltl]